MHLAITDSGLGGLSVCAEAERALRGAGHAHARITYFNVWPEADAGYNDLPDLAARARVFDRALSAMAAYAPDRIVIACNTLSIVYEATSFRQALPMPVTGIIEAGVGLFADGLDAQPDGSIVLFGSRSTIDSGTHRQRLLARGIDPRRITAVPCHGLAKAIETDPDSQAVIDLIEQYTAAAAQAPPPGRPLFLGVCCTHYTYVAEEMRAALERHCGREVRTLDPTDRLVREVLASGGRAGDQGDQAGRPAGHATVPVRVVSKVAMDETKRQAVARRIRRMSPLTADALLAYTRVPELF
jgi:glutamate racemase